MQRPQPEITLDDILITEELSRRSPRPPNLLPENQALHTLARQLVNQPEAMLQSLVDIALDLCCAGSAGVSLLEVLPSGEEVFRWNVLAGTLAQYVGGTTPRKESPCGTCLDRGSPQLFFHPEKYFTYFQAANTPVVEGLVLPLIADNLALGTIWIMSHDEQRHFDPEDVRVMTSLADFTAAALLRNQQQTRELLAANAALEAEIVERKQAEERSRALSENLPGGAAFVVDRDLRYLLAEGEALSAAGFKPEDLVGHTIFEVLPPELVTNYEVLYRKALAGESFEYEHNAHDRSYISRGTPLRSADGEVYAVLAVSYDISDRKQAEVALRESEEKYRTLVSATSKMVWTADAKGNIIAEVPGWESFTGQTFDEYKNFGWLAVLHPDDVEQTRQIWQTAIENHTTAIAEYRLRTMAGDYRRVTVRGEPLLKADGNLRGWVGTIADVEDMRRAAEAEQAALNQLRESEAKYRSLFESIDEGFCLLEIIYDEQGAAVDLRYHDTNRVFERQTGIANVEGKRAHEVIPNLEPFWIEIYDQVARTGESVRFENYVQGTDHWFNVYASRVGGVGSRFVAVVFDDITDRKRVEEALRVSEQRLQTAQKAGNVGVWDWDAASGKTYWSETMWTLYGYESQPDKTGDEIWESSQHPEDQQRVKESLAQFLASNETDYRSEFRIIQPNGSVRWIESVAQLSRDATGKPVRMSGVNLDITDRKQAEAALAHSRRQFEKIASTTPDLVYVFDLVEERNIFVNAGIHSVLGYSQAQIANLGSSLIGSLIHPDDIPGVIEGNQRFRDLGDRDVYDHELRMRHATGEYRWLRCRDAVFERTADGTVTQTIGTAQDITDRKRHEANAAFLAEIAEDFSRLSSAEEIMQAVGAKVGTYLNISNCLFAAINEGQNQAIVEYTWHTPDTPDLTGVYRLSDFITEDFRQAARSGETVIIYDTQTEPRIGKDRYAAFKIHAYVTVPFHREGEWKYLLTVNDSVARNWREDEIELIREVANRVFPRLERAYAEASVRSADARLRAMTDAVPVLIWETDETGVTFLNRYYLDFFGVSFENVREIGWAQFIHPDDAAGYETAWREAVQQRQPYTYDCRFLHADGQYRWLRNTGQPMGENRMVGCSLDITESKQAEEDRIRLIQEQTARKEERQRAETLAELDHAKTLFFSNVSHEFRTPLTLLLAPLQDALSDRVNPLAPSQRERLELAHRNAMRLLKLVNTLLDFSRIEAGRMEAVYEPTDLATYTTELASVFRSAIEQAGLRLIVDCPPLPPVYVDREMWEKIVLNLLSNAFKFTLEGEIGVRLHSTDGNRVMLQIQDTGIGIPPENLPHILDRFYQVRGAKARTHEGSGIGLALVHELIRLHGGTVDASSTVAQGTCFTVTIPLGTAHLPSDRIQAPRTLASTALGAAPYVEEAGELSSRGAGEQGSRGAGEQGSGGAGGKSKAIFFPAVVPLCPSAPSARILLVDDNADMRDYLTRILSDRFQVEAVADGAAALAAACERSPDLVLTDVMMPGLDGFQLLQALRASPQTREVPIILLSARAGEESVVEGLEAGADDYLIKPFSASELVSRVNAHLQMAQLRSEALYQERTINRRKDELLSTVSHELNTPLVAILGWTRLLRANPSNQSMLMKSLETIERNAMLQAKLIQDLLDISRITAGKLRLSQEPVELKSVIKMAIAAVSTAAIAKDIHLEWKHSSVQEASGITILGDRDRLQQIVCNLLINAIKFTPESGSVTVELSVAEAFSASEKSYVQIRVTDTGIGICAEFLPHVFDRFRQAKESDSAKGLGLGLAIARYLVELHNGTIHAESSGVGQGATFTVKLPILQQ